MAHSVKQLTPDLWLRRSELYLTNSGIFVSRGQALLIDPAVLPHEIRDIADFLTKRRLTPRVITLTHSHWDHILGPEQFPGVETIAHATYLDLVRERSAKIMDDIERWCREEGVRRDTPFEIPLPDTTFQDELDMQVGDLSFRLLHVPGHAADQLAVYEPDGETLWASDILSDVEIPFIMDRLAAYERTLRHLSTLDIRVLIPGHGNATTDASEIEKRFDEDTTYLAVLREHVARAIRDGRSVEETVHACRHIAYRRPDINDEPHRRNVESAYIELGGDADPGSVGWNRS